MVRALRGSARISQVATAASVSRATVSRVIAGWRLEESAAVLDGPQGPLARYDLGNQMPQGHAPRPNLHPVHTLKGIALTETAPSDHRHHYGLSIAVADLNGTSHWGGRTFIRDVGPTLLGNHGRQVSGGVRTVNGNATEVAAGGRWLVDDVRWYDQFGAPQLREERVIGGVLLPQKEAWALRWHSLLHADHGDLAFDSPATNGRAGAGYGGLFWRLPMADETRVLTESGTSEDGAHGSSSPWLVFAQRRADVWTTLILVQAKGAPRPWFVRAAEYVGAGPALAWDHRLTVLSGDTLELDLTAVLVDRRLDQRDEADLADLARSRTATLPSSCELG